MKEWLVVDGYNVINSWQDFRKFREENLEHARELLKEKLAERFFGNMQRYADIQELLFLMPRKYRELHHSKKTELWRLFSRMKVKPLIHGLNDAYMILLRAEAVFLL